MTITKEDLEIDSSLTVENAKEKELVHELDVLIDPASPQRGLEELLNFKSQGHSLGQPSEGKDERFVGVYESLPPGEGDQPLDLLDDEPDSSRDN